MISVLFVCLGNICRSPMAEGVFQHLVDQAGLPDQFVIDSGGTGSWHVGELAHHGTRDVLRRNGITYRGRSRQVDRSDLEQFDYVVAMDSSNINDLRRLDRTGMLDGKLHLLLDFAPEGLPRDVPDPYYAGNFDVVYDMVLEGCRGFLDYVRAQHDL